MKEDEELKREQIRQCSVLLPESFGTVQTGIASTNELLSAKLAVVLLHLAPSAPAFAGFSRDLIHVQFHNDSRHFVEEMMW